MVTVYISAISGRIIGHPANPQHLDLPQQIIEAEISSVVFTIIFYLIAALEESRRVANDKLLDYTRGLEKEVTIKEMDSEAKNDFISMLGHEIRNPMASLLSTVELLQTGAIDEDERENLVNNMESRIRSIGRLLDDIFDISRITRKKIHLKKAIISAREILQRTADSARHRLIENGHHFSVELSDENIIIDADPVRIEQIITNLLYNAAKYTPAGGSIDLCSSFKNANGVGVLTITVRDTGIGILAEEQERIFDPYIQINPEQTLLGGIGLGLTLARTLVEMHGGSIKVKSDGLGRGSEFIVCIPARIGESAVSSDSKLSRNGQDNLKILVVDDNVSAADGLSKLLNIYGYQVWAAYDGATALRMERELRPDVVLLDIGLPDIDGFELAKRMREAESKSKLIAITGYGLEMYRNKAKGAGFDRYLTKPVSAREIIESINSASNAT
jgi:signal transduction histidine kinase/CheY-like chemotaxis protein